MNLISPAEAQELMREGLEALGTERVPFAKSLGRVLREDLRADRAFPSFDRITMDGIAFRAADFHGQALTLQGIHAAGEPTPAPLETGACWQVMTGAICPEDCDTIVPYEEVVLSETHATVTGEISAGQFIHREGSDAPAGTLVVKAGTRLQPGHLGMMASIGAVEVEVTREPRIEILTTGDELVPVSENPLPHQLRQSNGPTLLAALASWGPAKATWKHLADDLATTTKAIAAALETSDLVIISGGISKGKFDFVRPALEELIGKPIFHGVAQRPGKPLASWPGVVALPGNPNSTLTTFQRYVVPYLTKLTGENEHAEEFFSLESAVAQHPKLTQFLPGKINGQGHAVSLSPQNSGDFITPLEATCYLEILPGDGAVHRARRF